MNTRDCGTVLFIKNVPPEIKQRFHAACANKGETMRDVVMKFMRDFGTRFKNKSTQHED